MRSEQTTPRTKSPTAHHDCGKHEAQRLVCHAAASWSYENSSDRLEEFRGLKVAENTVRAIAQQHGAAANEWLRLDGEAIREFREAAGHVEFTTDGMSVNTMDGWREPKVGIFSKRDRAKPATPEEWEARSLPKSKPRIAFAAIERSDDFGRCWKAWRKWLGLIDASVISVLADGAQWIWEERVKSTRQSEGVLNIFHAWQHLSDLRKQLHQCPNKTAAWTYRTRSTLLDPVRQASQHCLPKRTTIERKHSGSQVEGACRNLIGRRLMQTGARWRVRRVNRMAGLRALMDSS